MFWQVETAVICLCTLIAVYVDSSRAFCKSNLQEQSFRICALIVIAALVLDICIHLSVAITIAPVLSHILMTSYYTIVILAIVGWFRYTAVILYAGDEKRAKRMFCFAAIPFLLYFCLLIGNLWTGLLYSFDANGIYIRGTWFSLHVYTFLFYTAWIMILVLFRWQYIPIARSKWLLLFLPLLLFLGTLLQITCPGHLVMFPSYTVVLVICYLSIQSTRTRDIIAKSQIEVQRLSTAASTDGLTKLYNRAAAQDAILGLYERGYGKGCMLILADLDDLKYINDHYGHVEGDSALCALADVMRKMFRSSDILARVGGDEFMAFLPDVADPELLRPKLALMVEILSQQSVGPNAESPLHASFGAASGIMGTDDFATLYQQADAALYHAKRCGKNQYAYFTSGMQVNIQQ